ncbi:MAG TPA: oligosaccharide flippase family protein, partial [Gemmatimonadaceae bacterium]
MTEASAPRARALTKGSLLGRNAVLNIVGGVIPAIAAVIAVPILVRYQGDARFGVMALAWTSLGYFSLFDLGLGRAVTHAVADRLGAGAEHEIGSVTWTSLAVILPISLVAAAALAFASPLIVRLLSMPPELREEGVTAFRVLAVAVPFASLTGAFRGALEGSQNFGVVNALRIPLGVLTFLGPLATLPFSRSLVPAMAVLTAGRGALLVAHYIAVARVIPGFRGGARGVNRTMARSLMHVGGWMQVTHMISPLMATLDRFVVGAVLGAGVVTYYVVPQELVTKLWMFNIAVLPVFFSAVSTTALRDAERTVALFDKLQRATLSLLFLPSLVLVALAPDILNIWLGGDFAAQSGLTMQLFAVAVFINCL